MIVHTIGLDEAAAILHMTPEGVRRKAIAGEIPGSKPGKRWCFIEEDFVSHLRSLYTNNAKAALGAHSEEKSLCHFTNATTSGGWTSRTTIDEYKKALGLPTSKKQNSSMTSSKQISGSKNILTRSLNEPGMKQ
jgi:hypothetical protein